jgi:uncharacterized protein (DUF1501 family)
MTGLSRRGFLSRGAALGCSLAASPFLTPVTLASAPWDTRFVVIILRGGMDGLDVVQPYGDRNFSSYRPDLPGGEAGGGFDLDGYFSANQYLAPIREMWRAGEVGFAHAVSTPYRDKRSHFDGQDMLEAGTGMDVGIGAVRDGWLNRMLGQVPGVDARTAFAVGREDMILLNGQVPVSSWSPDTRLDLSPQGRRLLDELYHDDPVFQSAANLATDMVELLDMGDGISLGDEDGMSEAAMASMMQGRKASRAKALAQFAADRLNEDTRIAAFSINGWDTHRTQLNGLKPALGELSDALVTLKAGLGRNWQKTAVIAMTEFGRTVRQNGSRGTDHGTAGAMVLAGGAIRGGRVYGDWPGLGESDLYQNRDLLPTADVRHYPAWAMAGLMGLERSLIERVIFPGLDMASDPRILA